MDPAGWPLTCSTSGSGKVIWPSAARGAAARRAPLQRHLARSRPNSGPGPADRSCCHLQPEVRPHGMGRSSGISTPITAEFRTQIYPRPWCTRIPGTDTLDVFVSRLTQWSYRALQAAKTQHKQRSSTLEELMLCGMPAKRPAGRLPSADESGDRPHPASRPPRTQPRRTRDAPSPKPSNHHSERGAE